MKKALCKAKEKDGKEYAEMCGEPNIILKRMVAGTSLRWWKQYQVKQ